MEFRTLKYFLAIAREQNMTNAASVLHVSQSALSRQISDLEDELNTSLFIRTGRKMILTDDGMRLRKRAEEITSLVNRTEMEFLEGDDDVVGNVFIGAVETSAMYRISKVISQINKIYPHIQFHVQSGTSDVLSDKIDKGLLDFGILFEPFNKNRYDYIEISSDDHIGLITRADSEYANYEYITPEILKNIPILYSTRQKAYVSLYDGWGGLNSEDLNIAGSYNFIFNASLLVESGFGNALAIDGLLHNDSLKYIPLKPEIPLTLFFVWKKFQFPSMTSEIFLSEIKKEFDIN